MCVSVCVVPWSLRPCLYVHLCVFARAHINTAAESSLLLEKERLAAARILLLIFLNGQSILSKS